jgi:hypothetical protein
MWLTIFTDFFVFAEEKRTAPTYAIFQKPHGKPKNGNCRRNGGKSTVMKIIRNAHIPTDQNLADMFTKMLGAIKIQAFCQRILY